MDSNYKVESGIIGRMERWLVVKVTWPTFLNCHEFNSLMRTVVQQTNLMWYVCVFLPSNGPVLEKKLKKILVLLKLEDQEGKMEEVTSLDNLKVAECVPNWSLGCRILHFTALNSCFHLRTEATVSGGNKCFMTFKY